MGLVWIIGIGVSIYLIVTVYNYLDAKAQERGLQEFLAEHPNCFDATDTAIEKVESMLNTPDIYTHMTSFPDYGDCFCCERGKLVRRRNRETEKYFIGCTSWHPDESRTRYGYGRRYPLKSCNFTYPI